jgi:hypothetical protein
MNNFAEKSLVRSLTIDLDLLPKKDKAGVSLTPLHCHVAKEKTARPEAGEIFTFSYSVFGGELQTPGFIDDRLSFLTDCFSVRVRVRFQG